MGLAQPGTLSRLLLTHTPRQGQTIKESDVAAFYLHIRYPRKTHPKKHMFCAAASQITETRTLCGVSTTSQANALALNHCSQAPMEWHQCGVQGKQRTAYKTDASKSLRPSSKVAWGIAAAVFRGCSGVPPVFLSAASAPFCVGDAPPFVGEAALLVGDVTSANTPVSYTHLTLPTNREV